MKINNLTIKQLVSLYKNISHLDKINALINWDLNVYMPPKASEGRAEQNALLTEIITKQWKDGKFKEMLAKANDQKNLNDEEKAVVRNLNRSSAYYLKVPEEILIEKSKVSSEAFTVWAKARAANDFKSFLPFLKKLIELDQIIAEHIGYKQSFSASKENPYDALLDLHEPGLTAKFTKQKFDPLKIEISKLIKMIQKAKNYTADSDLINGKNSYPDDEQKKLAIFISRRMGYDLQAGRIDVSAHPFTTTLGRFDVRITNMYKLTDFRDSFTSTMHETGHALYEQNINPDYSVTPLEGGVSFGIHEALSRFWENQIGKNPGFLRFASPLFQSFYPDQLSGVTDETIVKLFNLVKPGFIRIEADEVTYTLHIILRFEIENDLINKKLKAEDAPEAWNAKMKELLGIVPETDTNGLLQDVHWSYGAFGYFPAYALGNLYASQFLSKMNEEFSVDEVLAKGEFGKILDWLNEHVHKYGALYWPDELVKVATGEDLNPQYFIDYLNNKYTSIYSL